MKSFRRFLAGLALAFVTAVSFAPIASAQALTDAAENSIIDAVLRAQVLGAPATFYAALDTTACSDSTAGTEVSGGSYARVAITSGLSAWAGTQGAGTTAASSGTGGVTSNNAAITFPAPTANWGTVGWFRLVSASTGGTTWFCQALTASKTINSGDAAPSFAIGAMTFTFQ